MQEVWRGGLPRLDVVNSFGRKKFEEYLCRAVNDKLIYITKEIYIVIIVIGRDVFKWL